jgi:hypothetical protein
MQEDQGMPERSIDKAEEANQRDQAEGERNDRMEQRVTRGPHGAETDTRQESVAEREPAEGGRSEADG